MVRLARRKGKSSAVERRSDLRAAVHEAVEYQPPLATFPLRDDVGRVELERALALSREAHQREQEDAAALALALKLSEEVGGVAGGQVFVPPSRRALEATGQR